MSEFSDSYQLKSSTTTDGLSLLRRAGLDGYVFPAENGWVTILAEGPMFEPNNQLIESNVGVLLHYMYAEDYGWSVEVYQGPDLVTQHECEWEPRLNVVNKLDVEAADRVLGSALCSFDTARLRMLLDPEDLDQVAKLEPAKAFAEAVGLTHFEWLSFEYIYGDIERGQALPEGVIAVLERDA
ncbi:hypothetical protein [Paucibacter sp. B51]|uniref:hypothetical protein n=1 Tax=Paucibacter sp. B51 TaxID=2993315 RepID=UPI0022EC1232|nr:hypothetical protein [Paucibacter sp. B51]